MIAGGVKYIVYGSRKDEIRLWNFADLHLGCQGVAKRLLAEDVQKVADDPCSFWLGGGDYAEYISYRDPRFDPAVVDVDLAIEDLGSLGRKLTGAVRDIFWPIRHKCVGLMDGNHETNYQRRTDQQQLTHWLCTELGTAYLGYSCLFDIAFVRNPSMKVPTLVAKAPGPKVGNVWRQRVYAHHGVGAARSEGGKLNRLIEFMGRFDADVTFMAHVHDQTAKRKVRLRGNAACTKLVEVSQLGICTGSYLRAYAEGPAGYAEKAAYDPVPLGAVAAKFTPDKRELKAEV